MAKNLVFCLDFPIQRKHEVAWLLVKNNFKAHIDFQNIFYTNSNIIYLNPISGFREDSYDFSIYTFEKDIKTKIGNIKGYEDLEKFAKNISKKEDFRQTE